MRVSGSLCVLIMAVLMAPGAFASPGMPDMLRCEYQINPLGIDTVAPRLSWWVNDDRRGAAQSAYQILVADTADALVRNEGTLWDSGKVRSDQSAHVIYDGAPLASNQRYYWKVRTWDTGDAVSPYSQATLFQMAPLSPDDWNARWIAATGMQTETVRPPLGKWLWHASLKEQSHVYVRHIFSVDERKPLRSAVLHGVADNHFTPILNGTALGTHKGWKPVKSVDVTDAIVPGRNILALELYNNKGECGFVCGLQLDYEDGTTEDILSDETWRVSLEHPEGWQDLAYDDSDWDTPVILAQFGEPPWGDVWENVPDQTVALRKEFDATGAIHRATVHVTGLGLYTLYLDGQRVGNDTLTPGWTHYKKHIQYQSYDVTDLLMQHGAAHALGVRLGNGWWGAQMAGSWNDTPPRLLLQLDIEYADGTRQQVVTDTSWKAHSTPILADSHYHGVTYDARLERPGWDLPGYDDSDWLPVQIIDKPLDVLAAQAAPPIRVTEELFPVSITQPQNDVYVYDFGQNMAGRCRLRVEGPAGTRVQIRFAEVLNDDGTIYTENYRSAKATDVYILKGGGVEIWEPEFTYRGFRYAELTGYPGTPNAGSLTARVLHNAMPFTGEFSSSSAMLNKLHQNIQWGQRSNLHSVPTDCPQRDERLGWTGDAQTFAPTSCWIMDMAAFYRKWLRDITDSQDADGKVKDINPQFGGGAARPGWGDVMTVLPWTAYLFYGDTRFLEENYDGMRGWVEYMRGIAEDGLLYDEEGYGDWVAPVESPKKPIGCAYYFYSTKLLAQAADVLGRTEDATHYHALANEIAAAVNAKYLDDTDNYPGGTQTANLLPLHFGITPHDRRAGVVDNIAKDIIARDYHLSTGFLGTAYLLPALTQYGRHDLAVRLALQRTNPSWGYPIDQGATTIWERWNSNQIDEVGAEMNSFNHFCFGAVGQWFYESLAGININPKQPGFKHIILKPQVSEAIPHAKAAYTSTYGPIRSECTWGEGIFRMHVTIPANTSATLYMPASNRDAVYEGGVPAVQAEGVMYKGFDNNRAIYTLGAGTYTFESRGL